MTVGALVAGPHAGAGTSSAPIVLVAHGSRDPRSAATTRALAAAVADRWDGGARAAFLDFDTPTLPTALRAVGGGDRAIVVPLLLTHAYHGRVDVPGALADSGVGARLTPVLGPVEPGRAPDGLLIAALVRRLAEVATGYDGVVLAGAGTSYPSARSTVDTVAAVLSSTVNTDTTVGYASAAGPTVGQAVAALRERGRSRIAVASFFLAPGRLYDAAAAEALAAGAVAVAAPLGTADEIVRLVLRRAADAH